VAQLLNRFQIDKYIYLKETHSTNQHATNLLSISNPNHNFCIYTYNQTDGKGQIGRKWYTSKNENLAATYVINNLNLKVRDHFYLNMAISLALCQFTSNVFPDKLCTIKWPNDIYINQKKIAGILIQNQVKGSIISKTTIGIGLNVNTTNFPEDLPNPTSLKLESYGEPNSELLDVLEKLTVCISQKLSWINLYNEKIRKNYLSKLFRLNELSYYKSEGKVFEGKILGIAEDGQLILDTNTGVTKFAFREISFEKLK